MQVNIYIYICIYIIYTYIYTYIYTGLLDSWLRKHDSVPDYYQSLGDMVEYAMPRVAVPTLCLKLGCTTMAWTCCPGRRSSLDNIPATATWSTWMLSLGSGTYTICIYIYIYICMYAPSYINPRVPFTSRVCPNELSVSTGIKVCRRWSRDSDLQFQHLGRTIRDHGGFSTVYACWMWMTLVINIWNRNAWKLHSSDCCPNLTICGCLHAQNQRP